jgi:hypothetical protein
VDVNHAKRNFSGNLNMRCLNIMGVENEDCRRAIFIAVCKMEIPM